MANGTEEILRKLDALERRVAALEGRGTLPPRPALPRAPAVAAPRRGLWPAHVFALVAGIVAILFGLLSSLFGTPALVLGLILILGALFLRPRAAPRAAAAPAAAGLPAPTVAPPAAAPAAGGAELEVGRKWLPVVGVALLFLGVALFVSYVFRFIGPGGKVLLSYLTAAVLFGVAVSTKRRFALFSNIVFAGAWGVAYLTTYAAHFVNATRIIASPGLALALLSVVVAALVLVAIATSSRWMVAYGLALGFLTSVLSPLSLFSVGSFIFLFAVAVVLTWALSWDELLFPASLAAALSYLIWFADAGGRYAAQGGGLFEKHLGSLLAVILLWLFAAVGLAVRRGAGSRLGQGDGTATLLLLTLLTTLFGLGSLRELAAEAARTVSAVYLLAFAGAHAALGFLVQPRARAGGLPAAAVILATLFLTAGLGLFFPPRSVGLSLTWAVLGVLFTLGAVLARAPRAALLGAIPFVGSTLRFFVNDLDATDLLAGALPARLVVGIGLALIVGGSAVASRQLARDTGAIGARVPGGLIALSLAILFAVAHREFPGAFPTVLWGMLGLGAIAGGFFGRWTDARKVGLVALAAAVLRVFLHDLAGLDPLPRVVAFIVLGAILLLIGYGYNRNRAQIQRFLAEG